MVLFDASSLPQIVG